MTTRSRGASAGFNWLSRGIGAGFSDPKPLFGGAALVALLSLIPSFIIMPIEFYWLHAGMTISPAMIVSMMSGSLLFHLLMLPIYAGFFLLFDACERMHDTPISTLFKPYRDGQALRVMLYGLVMMVIYLALFGAIVMSIGSGIPSWYVQLLTARAHHIAPPSGLPDGFWTAYLLCMLMGLLMLGVHSIGFGQLVVGQRSVLGAVGEGFTGMLKNILPLIVFALSSIVAGVGIALVFGLCVVLLAFIAKMISPLLIFVIIIPLYIALFIFIVASACGVMYHIWRDVCSDGTQAEYVEPVTV